MSKKRLRFAPIIRVSTEEQEKKGESLRLQKEQILGYVKSLNGVIPERCWKYSGQEHATVGEERQKLSDLLEDSAKGWFDAVIVCDPSRWSRDNSENKRGLRTLQESGIRFFIGTSEKELNSPSDMLILGMFGEINEFFGLEQARKSIENRIARARRGIPAAGRLPYGRTFDKEKEKWGLDEEKVERISRAAQRYLHGESNVRIAQSLKMNSSNLWKILNRQSGDVWEQSFKSVRLKISETVLTPVPRLLPEETIFRIREKAEANKTYEHGKIRNEYLLSRMIFCAHCENAMFGQTNHGKTRYYRHGRDRKKPCDPSHWVSAKEIEEAVLMHLFTMFSSVTAAERAVSRAYPDMKKRKKLEQEREELTKRLRGIDEKEENILRKIADGLIRTNHSVDKIMTEIYDHRERARSRIEAIAEQLARLPEKRRVRARASTTHEFLQRTSDAWGGLDQMPFQVKREILQHVFGGKDLEGRRRGVYVEKGEQAEGENRRWWYSMKGDFWNWDRLEISALQPSRRGRRRKKDSISDRAKGGRTKSAMYLRGTGPPGCRSPARPCPPHA